MDAKQISARKNKVISYHIVSYQLVPRHPKHVMGNIWCNILNRGMMEIVSQLDNVSPICEFLTLTKTVVIYLTCSCMVVYNFSPFHIIKLKLQSCHFDSVEEIQ